MFNFFGWGKDDLLIFEVFCRCFWSATKIQVELPNHTQQVALANLERTREIYVLSQYRYWRNIITCQKSPIPWVFFRCLLKEKPPRFEDFPEFRGGMAEFHGQNPRNHRLVKSKKKKQSFFILMFMFSSISIFISISFIIIIIIIIISKSRCFGSLSSHHLWFLRSSQLLPHWHPHLNSQGGVLNSNIPKKIKTKGKDINENSPKNGGWNTILSYWGPVTFQRDAGSLFGWNIQKTITFCCFGFLFTFNQRKRNPPF